MRDRSEQLRVAIVGAGLMGRWHLAAAAWSGAEIVAVIDPDHARAARIAGSAAILEDFSALPENLACDVVHICTPSATHENIVTMATQRGIHAFVEKPLAQDEPTTRVMIDLADRAGLQICPVHQYAFQAGIEKVRSGLARVGDIALIDLDFRTAGAVGRPPRDYAGFAADILPHPISILQRILPRAIGPSDVWNITGQPNGTFTLGTVTGSTLVRITISLMARPTCATLTVSGDKGSYVTDMYHGYTLFRNGTATRQSKMIRPFVDGFGHLGKAAANLTGRAIRREAAYPGLRTLCGRFYDSLVDKGPPPISPRDIIEVAAIRDLFLARLGSGGAVP